jgi:hypothetical protein
MRNEFRSPVCSRNDANQSVEILITFVRGVAGDEIRSNPVDPLFCEPFDWLSVTTLPRYASTLRDWVRSPGSGPRQAPSCGFSPRATRRNGTPADQKTASTLYALESRPTASRPRHSPKSRPILLRSRFQSDQMIPVCGRTSLHVGLWFGPTVAASDWLSGTVRQLKPTPTRSETLDPAGVVCGRFCRAG